ncbi:Ig-like domain-containing protein [Edaphobacter aggregans]|uniref:Ig-like domain-containing protein n=1 Tax=Edaphobacter aggregans TaxID=570835 RepID=UPI00054E76E6|nr:Ig-like domain-containing protein [Edaphobacter aggregans]
MTVTVAQDTTTMVVASSANPVPAGVGVVYTAPVAGAHGPAMGSVKFLDGTVSMGSAAMDANGTAALSVLMMVPGTHAITAVYAGSASSAGSTSAVLSEVVQAPLAATTTTLTSDANPAVAGQSVTFTAMVAATGGKLAAGGMVTFVEGGTVLGSAAVNPAGEAEWSTAALSVGRHSIVARYAGDAATAASVSRAMNEVVNEGAVPGYFTISVDQITVVAGETAAVPVKVTMGSGSAKAVSLSCSGLPDEASCSFVSGTVAAGGGTATLKISTAGPRDCGSSVPYGLRVTARGCRLRGLC